MTSERTTSLEERQTWLERDLEELSRVVANQHAVIERLRKDIEDLRASARTAAPADPEARTLEDDRPPHY